MRNWCLQTRSAQAKTTLMENSPHSAKIPCEGVLDRMPRKRSIVPETHRWNPFQGKPWRDSKAQKNQHILTLIEESTPWKSKMEPEEKERTMISWKGDLESDSETIGKHQFMYHSQLHMCILLSGVDSRTWKAFSMEAKQKLWHQTIVLTLIHGLNRSNFVFLVTSRYC